MKIKYYQLAYLLPPEKSQVELKEIEEKITSFLDKEGVLDKIEPPLKRTLFYEIKKKKEAYLQSIYFYLRTEKIKDFDKLLKELKRENEILRFLIVAEKTPKKVPTKLKKIVKPKKVEIEELEKKLEEILGEKL